MWTSASRRKIGPPIIVDGRCARPPFVVFAPRRPPGPPRRRTDAARRSHGATLRVAPNERHVRPRRAAASRGERHRAVRALLASCDLSLRDLHEGVLEVDRFLPEDEDLEALLDRE